MNREYAKNDIVELTIRDLTEDGMGIGGEGVAVFARGALPGETVRARIIKKARSYYVARTEEILVSSPERVVPPCGVFPRCGGCTLMHLSYAGQLEHKRSRVAACLKRIGGVEADVPPVLPSPEVLRYRNKAAFPIARDGIGCYASHSHNVVNSCECLLQRPEADVCRAVVREYMRRFAVEPYDETTHSGLLRHMVTRTSAEGETILALVTNGKTLPHADWLTAAAREALPNLSGVLLNINMARTNVILGREMRVLFGRDFITEKINGVALDISMPAFLQINHAQTEKLYRVAAEFAALTDDETVADLYCGAGSIALNIAPRCKRVFGIELVPEAIENAKSNAAKNGIKNASFICGDCADVFRGVDADAVIVDPPRAGLAEGVVPQIAATRATRVVYVSCDPATLARDVKRFSEHGFILSAVQPVDMFPQSGHVETVCLLSKLPSEHHIEVNLNLDEMI